MVFYFLPDMIEEKFTENNVTLDWTWDSIAD